MTSDPPVSVFEFGSGLVLIVTLGSGQILAGPKTENMCTTFLLETNFPS